MSPLHVACKNGQIGVLKALLAAGARLSVGTKDRVYPIHFAAQCTRGAAALRQNFSKVSAMVIVPTPGC